MSNMNEGLNRIASFIRFAALSVYLSIHSASGSCQDENDIMVITESLVDALRQPFDYRG